MEGLGEYTCAHGPTARRNGMCVAVEEEVHVGGGAGSVEVRRDLQAGEWAGDEARGAGIGARRERSKLDKWQEWPCDVWQKA